MASKAVEGVPGGDKNEKEKPLHNMPPHFSPCRYKFPCISPSHLRSLHLRQFPCLYSKGGLQLLDPTASN